MDSRQLNSEFIQLKNLLIRYLDQVITQLKQIKIINIQHDQITQWKAELQNIATFVDYRNAILKFDETMELLLKNLDKRFHFVKKIEEGKKLTAVESIIWKIHQENVAFMSSAWDDIAEHCRLTSLSPNQRDTVYGNAEWRNGWNFIRQSEIENLNSNQQPLAINNIYRLFSIKIPIITTNYNITIEATAEITVQVSNHRLS